MQNESLESPVLLKRIGHVLQPVVSLILPGKGHFHHIWNHRGKKNEVMT